MNTKLINDIKLKILMIVAVIMVSIGLTEAFSQASVYRIQSLFLYNFTKHIKWENTEGATFTVGIYGNADAFQEIKVNLENKQAWGKNINVIEITSAADLNKCHIAYMPKSNKKRILDLIDGTDLSNTLLVTEGDLMDSGAAISFVYEQSKMNFKISKTKIEQVGLKVSSSLISIGIPV